MTAPGQSTPAPAERDHAACLAQLDHVERTLAAVTGERDHCRAQLADARRDVEARGQSVAVAMGRYRGTEPLIDAVRRLATDHHDLRAQLAQLAARGPSPA